VSQGLRLAETILASLKPFCDFGETALKQSLANHQPWRVMLS
jgi:hypothetical protein